MELKSYAAIILRRWPIILAITALVAVLGVARYETRTTQFVATSRVSITKTPDGLIPDEYQYDEYYNYLASEFAIDDLVEITRGSVFAENVARRLRANDVDVSLEDVQSGLSTERRQRVLSLKVTSSNPDRSTAIARAAAEELESNPAGYLPTSDTGDTAKVRMVEIADKAKADTGRARVLLVLSVVVAGGFGFLLALLAEYFDDRLYDPETVSRALDLPHLASVPGDRQ